MLACGKSRDNKTIYYHKGKRISSKKARSIAKKKKKNLEKICSRNNPITCTNSRNNRDMYFYQGKHISRKRLSILSNRGRAVPECLKKTMIQKEPIIDDVEQQEKDIMISQLQSENRYLEEKVEKISKELRDVNDKIMHQEGDDNEITISQLQSENGYLEEKVKKLTKELREANDKIMHQEGVDDEIRKLQKENEKLLHKCKDCDMTKLKVIKNLQDRIEDYERREKEMEKVMVENERLKTLFEEEGRKWEEEKMIVQYVLNDCAEDRNELRSCNQKEREMYSQMDELRQLFEQEKKLSDSISKELQVLQQKCSQSDTQLRSVKRIEQDMKKKDDVIEEIMNEVESVPIAPPITSTTATNNVDNLLKAIEKGKDLRKVEIQKSDSSKNDLLSEIQQGKKLKKVKSEERPRTSKKEFNDKLKLLEQRRQFLRQEEDEDEWNTQYIQRRRKNRK